MCKVFFFLLRSVGRRDLSAGPEQKKKNTTQGVFFLLRPRGKAREGEAPLEAGTGPAAKKTTPTSGVFFLLRPRGKAGERRSFSVGLAFRTGPAAKKKHPGWCFFFCCWPRAGRSLTHCGPGWRCLPLPFPGAVFFFLQKKKPDPGWFFFVCCGSARTLTHSRWAGAISARPGCCFFFFAAASPCLFRQ